MTDRRAKVTIKSIADELGISHMTVSRALSGSPKVTVATAELVRARATALGYVASNAARLMRGSTSHTIGLCLPNIENEFYASLANAVSARATSAGLQVMFGLSRDEDAAEAAILRQFRAQEVGAIVLVPAPRASMGEDVGGPPTLQIVRERAGEAWDSLRIDDGTAIAEAVRFLAAGGHRRIAYLGPSPRLSTGAARLEAFRVAMGRLGLPTEHIHTAASGTEGGAAGFAALMERPAPPTGLVLGGVEISNGAIAHALTLGVAVPGTLAIVGYGDPVWYRWVFGGLPRITLPTDALSERIINWCARHITGNLDPVEEASLRATFIAR